MAAVNTALLPLKYYLATLSKSEEEQTQHLLRDLMYEVKELKKKEGVADFFKSDEGQRLIKTAIVATVRKPGKIRTRFIARLAAAGVNGSPFLYSAQDFIDIVAELNEAEFDLLNTAYHLYDKKSEIGKPRTNSVISPDILQWTELHASFPKLTPIEMVAVFNRLQRTGLVIREQGFMDDNGSMFAFTPILANMIAFSREAHQ